MGYHLDVQEQRKGTDGYDVVSERFGSIFLEWKRDVAFGVCERLKSWHGAKGTRADIEDMSVRVRGQRTEG